MESSLTQGKVYIKQKKTELYYLHPQRWVSTKDTATGFSNTVEATKLCFDLRLSRVELFLDFGNPEENLHLPAR